MFSKNTKDIRQALARLNVVRCAIEIYKSDHDGESPASLQELVPKYISSIPELFLPGHKNTSDIRTITKDGELCHVVSNTGGWLYFFTPGCPGHGKVVLDCSDVFNDRELYKY